LLLQGGRISFGSAAVKFMVLVVERNMHVLHAFLIIQAKIVLSVIKLWPIAGLVLSNFKPAAGWLHTQHAACCA
jgi:hypothetical protein